MCARNVLRFGFSIMLLAGIISCDDTFFPPGLYDYQVERLLTNDSTKTWRSVSEGDICESLNLVITNATDSLTITRICDTDSITNNAKLSSVADGILFTDSVQFSTGETWIIHEITSDFLLLHTEVAIETYVH